MNYGSSAEVRYSVSYGKLSSMVFKGFTIANILMITELLDNGYSGTQIRIIEKRSQPQDWHQNWDFQDIDLLFDIYPVEDGYNDKIKGSLQKAYDYFDSKKISMDFNTTVIKIDYKHMKYTTHDTAEHIKYNGEKAQETVLNKKARQKEIRKTIKENRHLGNYFANDQLENEMNSINLALNSMAPTETERPYAKFVLHEKDLDWFIGPRNTTPAMNGFKLKDHDGIIVVNNNNCIEFIEQTLGI